MRIRLSAQGPECSRLALGAWKWEDKQPSLTTVDLESLIEQSLEAGITTFDHADLYGDYSNEAKFGAVLKRNPSLRDKMEIVTKFGIKLISENRPTHQIKSYDTGKTHILSSVENSLRELHIDHIDILLIHRPSPLMDVDEIAESFSQLQAQGKVLHFGVSNFSPSQFELLNSRIPLVTNQVQISAMYLDAFLNGTLEQCLRLGITPMAWSPLGGGGIFSENNQARTKRVRIKALQLAEKYEASLDQILLAWLLKHPAGIIPILGTTHPDRVRSAAGATRLNLSREEWFELWQASTGEPVP